MAIGDVTAVDGAGVSDCYCVDTGMYDTPDFGSVYVIDAARPAVVDTGIGTHVERVLDALDAVGVGREALAVVAPTHVHLDHAGGAGYLAEACPNATVAVHAVGAPHLVDPSRLVAGTKAAVGDEWDYYAEPKPVPAERVRELADGDVLDLGDRALEVHGAPGHAPHQVVFHEPDDGVVFTADAAGIYVPPLDDVQPTTPPPNFDLEQCLADVETLADLDPDVLCYGHFGPAPTADRLDTYARVLRSWVADVERAREANGDDVDAIAGQFTGRDDLASAWGERRARAHVELNVRGVLHYLDRREDRARCRP